MRTSSNDNRRWAVIRRSTGNKLRSFDSRANARDFKRYTGGNLVIFDTLNQEYVR